MDFLISMSSLIWFYFNIEIMKPHEELPDKTTFLIGIISDTHGLLRPEAVEALQGSDLIIHAGDAGNEMVLYELRNIAPVVAVRGNMDAGGWAYKLKRAEIVEQGQTLIYVLHDINCLDLEPSAANIKVVITGHTHKPVISNRREVLYINPGSAGPCRLKLPVSVALLKIEGASVDAKIIQLLQR